MNRRLLALPGVLVVALGCGGCAWLVGGSTRKVAREREVSATEPDAEKPISSAQLDELTRAFADRYVGLLFSTSEALKKDNPDPVQRREAQMLLVDCSTNVYDIASNADAFTRVLDLVVVTTLVSQVWIDDDRAGAVFGDRAGVLVRTLRHGRVEAWALAGQVLRPDQLDLLDHLLWDWRRQNPDMVRASFVRFSNFAIGRGESANAEVISAGGFLAQVFPGGILGLFVSLGEASEAVGQASRAVDETRLFLERAFYMLKRQPTLLRWQVETMKEDLVATPEVGKTLADVHRLAEQVEQLPRNVAAERQAIFAALDDQVQAVDKTVTNVRGALTEANQVAVALGRTADSLNEMVNSADALVARFDRPDSVPSTQPSRPFDIREYTEGVKELGLAAGQLNDLLQSSNELLGSPEWERRIQQASEAADGRMAMAVEQGQRLVSHLFRGIYLALGALLALLILNRVMAFVLSRRRKTKETSE